MDFLEQNARAALLFFERLDRRGDGTLNDVIAQDHAYFLTIGEVFGQGQRVGNAALAFLVGVVQVS